ncbi:MAG TPA: saccharopine dehydrogenase NADP-binding domain-containing protein [Thermoplasmata archaeon]|nr:saccharopine dehydrogenase NADP-binding domain-containing protein [Thermoplasmata archaeon]
MKLFHRFPLPAPGRTTRIFSLGGTGRIGRPVAQRFVQSSLVSEVAIAGRDRSLAEGVAAELGPKAKAVEVDATDEKQLASLAARYDLIVNTAGPDFRVALPVLRAAIAARVNSCDLAADGASIPAMLALDGTAKDAGITAVTGIGHIPGMSNLMMQHALNRVEAAEDVRLVVWWDLSREKANLFGDPDEMRRTGRINASWQTVLAWTVRPVRTYRDGRFVDVDPFEESTQIALPRDAGTVSAIPIGSTEPITIPRRNPEVRSVSILMALYPPQLHELLQDQARRIGRGESDVATATLAFLDTIRSDSDRWLTTSTPISLDFGMMATATGKRRGRTVRYSCWPAGPWESTVGALTEAAFRVLRGEVRSRGVLAPEAAFDPLPFLEAAARQGSKGAVPRPLLEESEQVI